MGVLLPADSRVRLQAQIRRTAPEDLHLVLLGLSIEDLPARERDDPGPDALLLQDPSGLYGDLDLGAGGDDVDVLLAVRNVVEDVATLHGVLDGGVHEIGQVLAGQCYDGRGVTSLEGDEVGRRGLVAVGRTPEVQVGDGAEVHGNFHGLMGRSVLAKTDRVVSGNPDDLMLGKGAQTDGTDGVRDEVLQIL